MKLNDKNYQVDLLNLVFTIVIYIAIAPSISYIISHPVDQDCFYIYGFGFESFVLMIISSPLFIFNLAYKRGKDAFRNALLTAYSVNSFPAYIFLSTTL
jgi:hypothetical protein